jgi:RNA polymerase sigma factor (sigma-70 family)
LRVLVVGEGRYRAMPGDVPPPGPPPVDGDAEFAALYDREAGRLVAYLVSTDGALGWQDAEDLAQEAFLVTRGRWSLVRCYDSPAAFLFRTAHLLKKNHHRMSHRRAADPFTALEELRPASAADLEAAMDLHGALDLLPERQRQVVLLRELVGFSVRETAAILGLSEGTVKSTRSDALQRLRSVLGDDGWDGGGGGRR